MSADLQVKVLRVLEEGEFERVGGHETIKVDARIIAATTGIWKRKSRRAISGRPFYRLYVIPIMLPSLRSASPTFHFCVSLPG